MVVVGACIGPILHFCSILTNIFAQFYCNSMGCQLAASLKFPVPELMTLGVWPMVVQKILLYHTVYLFLRAPLS